MSLFLNQASLAYLSAIGKYPGKKGVEYHVEDPANVNVCWYGSFGLTTYALF
jgi:hypothetical protein